MFSNLTPARQKVTIITITISAISRYDLSLLQLLIKISIFLNLCLLLYLSLSAGSRISLITQPSHPAPLAEVSSRENRNKFSDDSDQKTQSILPIEKSCDPSESRPATRFSLSENVSCLNKPIEFSQVRIKSPTSDVADSGLPCRGSGAGSGFSTTTSELLESSTVTRPSPTRPMVTLHSLITWSPSWRDGRDPSLWLSTPLGLI